MPPIPSQGARQAPLGGGPSETPHEADSDTAGPGAGAQDHTAPPHPGGCGTPPKGHRSRRETPRPTALPRCTHRAMPGPVPGHGHTRTPPPSPWSGRPCHPNVVPGTHTDTPFQPDTQTRHALTLSKIMAPDSRPATVPAQPWPPTPPPHNSLPSAFSTDAAPQPRTQAGAQAHGRAGLRHAHACSRGHSLALSAQTPARDPAPNQPPGRVPGRPDPHGSEASSDSEPTALLPKKTPETVFPNPRTHVWAAVSLGNRLPFSSQHASSWNAFICPSSLSGGPEPVPEVPGLCQERGGRCWLWAPPHIPQDPCQWGKAASCAGAFNRQTGHRLTP